MILIFQLKHHSIGSLSEDYVFLVFMSVPTRHFHNNRHSLPIRIEFELLNDSVHDFLTTARSLKENVIIDSSNHFIATSLGHIQQGNLISTGTMILSPIFCLDHNHIITQGNVHKEHMEIVS